MSLSVSLLAGMTASNQYIVGILDNGIATPVSYNQTSWASATPTSIGTPSAGVQAGATAFPQLSGLSVVSASDAGGVADPLSFNSGNLQAGYVKVTLTPAAGDVVNASSPMQRVFSPNALAIVASTATG